MLSLYEIWLITYSRLQRAAAAAGWVWEPGSDEHRITHGARCGASKISMGLTPVVHERSVRPYVSVSVFRDLTRYGCLAYFRIRSIDDIPDFAAWMRELNVMPALRHESTSIPEQLRQVRLEVEGKRRERAANEDRARDDRLTWEACMLRDGYRPHPTKDWLDPIKPAALTE